jgi:hypothetical protein
MMSGLPGTPLKPAWTKGKWVMSMKFSTARKPFAWNL